MALGCLLAWTYKRSHCCGRGVPFPCGGGQTFGGVGRFGGFEASQTAAYKRSHCCGRGVLLSHCGGLVVAFTCSVGVARVQERQDPHLRWSQAPPRPWRRPGSADIVLYYIILYYIILCYIILYCIVLYYIILYYIILYYIILHYIII